ncbi:endonuclease III domain-containing protein [Thiohalobacter sp. IOR34]|uniref:endonuclease III domain-containing protein n=1 Tax=Thiohalobacter sp. IOR34 TaxID=3057176 RepID=UPI0025AEDB23|nr:endonuclease III domain-containing protein [Thiohalobacter sp. IOR34]WJW76825.1 endonuclease III domain-containing protein [Thiohalobacter sp. IOR34]
MRLPARRLRSVHDRLLRAYGSQHWWPADSPFEVMVGAILTQNTAWSNVERAIANLRRQRCLGPRAILAADPAELADWLRPSGYFNVKARRLRDFCAWYQAAGGLRRLRALDTQVLREALLSVKGVGPETADDMLLYAFERPVFVIDAYTRRLFFRLGLLESAKLGYEPLRHAVERALGEDVSLFNEFHALIVRHAKEHCRARPVCTGCPLARGCRG